MPDLWGTLGHEGAAGAWSVPRGGSLRFLHTSDWHLGRAFHGESLLTHQGAFLEWLLELALAREVQAVVVAGDIYDRAVPPVEAVALLDRTLVAFSAAGVPLLLTSGNHDHAVRLGFGADLARGAGVRLCTSLEALTDPLILADEHGSVGFYGVPYLVPDAVRDDLGADRSHASVLRAACARAMGHAEAAGLTRTVVVAHAFVAGGTASDSERAVAVGGIGDTPSAALDGPSYVALGHLHGPQEITLHGSATRLRYSGSPLAFSFSERHHTKSVALVEIDAAGTAEVELVAAPVPRALVEVRGTLAELVENGRRTGARYACSWVRAVITDRERPLQTMEALRTVWPHTVDLTFEPAGACGADPGVVVITATTDPVDVCARFVAAAGGSDPVRAEITLLRAAIEAALHEQTVA